MSTASSARRKISPSKGLCNCGKTKPTSMICTKPANQEFCERFSELYLNVEHLKVFMRKLSKEVEMGLTYEGNIRSDVKCFVTHFQKFINGKENSGEFLILDVKPNLIRIVFVNLRAKNKSPLTMEKKYEISQGKKEDTVQNFFDYIAGCLDSFLKDFELEEKELPLGFSFNFPLRPEGESKGFLTRWIDGFKCTDGIGEDVVSLLEDALQTMTDVKIQNVILLNETIGTFMYGVNYNPKGTLIGVTMGERCNACYVENQENAELFQDIDYNSGKVLINTEWFAFGENGQLNYLLTDFDRTLDNCSANPGLETFEKLVSYEYLGELVRIVLVQLTEEHILFCGKLSEELSRKGSFKTDYVSQIEFDPPGRYDRCINILNCKLNLKHHKERDYINVRYVCELFSRRAAQLIAAGIATLLIRINDCREQQDVKKITVACDGVLFKSHPFFPLIIRNTIDELLVSSKVQFELLPVEDGPGIGNAYAIIMSNRQKFSKSATTKN